MRYIRYGIALLILVRLIYSLPYLLAALTQDWVLPPWDGPDPGGLQRLAAISGMNLTLWICYMLAYLATAILVLVRRRFAPLMAFLAALTGVILDMGYWIFLMMTPEHLANESASLSLRDGILNAGMLIVLLGTALLLAVSWDRKSRR